jgi:hypothetical protein
LIVVLLFTSNSAVVNGTVTTLNLEETGTFVRPGRARTGGRAVICSDTLQVYRGSSRPAAVALPKGHWHLPCRILAVADAVASLLLVCCPDMSTSPVSSASLAIFLFILLPTFSSSSCPSELQCNSTEPIEIRPPFFVGTPGLDPACGNSINVSCGQLGPELDLATDSKLLLKEIRYDSHTVVVQDVQLSILNNSACSQTFIFRPPVDNFESSYPDLVRWFSLISCGHSNVTIFHSIFGDDKEVHQSIQPDERGLASCHASLQFEWILSFSEVGSAGQIPLVNFSVQSGSIRKYLLSLSDCVSPSPGGNMPRSLLFLYYSSIR